ncbi:MAG TPA: M14 family zinc carboxypeptidase [Longimicrobiaceae bacterium]|nr:M14 family zinc carboxypeptidase [Longimicrobiaceae bacterium]
MSRLPYVFAGLLLASCTALPSPATGPSALPPTSQITALQEQYRVDEIQNREFTHSELWSAIGPIIDESGNLEREEIGQSGEGRPLYSVRFGDGPTRVLLWSQMHGDESTATMALADIFNFFAESPDHPLVEQLADELTIVAVPMLNPDGAQRFQRRNAYGVDVNRDARMLSTPEARALKALHDSFDPDFGFNLHDQNIRTRVGSTDRQAAISLLAPAIDSEGTYNDVRNRARKVAAVIRNSIEPLVGGHITQYDATFNPRAFGDLVQSWGTSTVLIESGGWADDPEKQYLRQVNFVAILSALDAIATGSYAAADPERYNSLPMNGRSASDLLVTGGTVVIPGLAPIPLDISVNFENPLERRGGEIDDIGDLQAVTARQTLDITGLFVHPTSDALEYSAQGDASLQPGAPASFTVRRGVDPNSEVVWVVEDGRVRRGN